MRTLPGATAAAAVAAAAGPHIDWEAGYQPRPSPAMLQGLAHARCLQLHTMHLLCPEALGALSRAWTLGAGRGRLGCEAVPLQWWAPRGRSSALVDRQGRMHGEWLVHSCGGCGCCCGRAAV